MERETVRARIDERRRWGARHLEAFRSLPWLALVLLTTLPCAQARALDVAVARAPGDRALGMERAASSLAFAADAADDAGARWRFDAGEWTLFEIDGLAAGSCAGEVRCRGWGGIVAWSILSSPVGRETALAGTFLASRVDRVGLAGGLRLDSVSLDGCERQFLLSFSVDAVVRLSPRVVLCARVGGVRVSGVPRPGADASLRVVAFPAGPISGTAGVAVARDGRVACGVSSRLRLGRRFHAVLGYDDGTAAINGSLAIGFRAFALEAGASVHPVLGVSKSLFVSWRRGPWE